MDVKLLKYSALNCFTFMVLVVTVSLIVSKNNQTMIYANGAEKLIEAVELQYDNTENNVINNQNINNENKEYLNLIHNKMDVSSNTNLSPLAMKQELGSKYIVISKSKDTYKNIYLEDLYMERSIQVTVTGLTEEDIKEDSLVRVNQDREYTGMPVPVSEENTAQSDELSDPVYDYSVQYTYDNDTALYTAVMSIKLDHIYACILYEDSDNIFIDLRRPKVVYKKILVVDAGHGGKDCGTFSKGEAYYEKDINLSIAMDLRDFLEQQNIKVYYTRTTDQTVFLNPRVELANEVDADFFISIHCNSNDSSEPNGTQVLYNEVSKKEGFESKLLAQVCLEEVTKVTKENRGLVNGNDILIINKAKMPVALVEVAFMSNDEDMKFLLKQDNRKNIAKSINNAIMKAFDILEQ